MQACRSEIKSLPDPTSANPVFVVGVLRSGTSLLYALLNQHPQIALMYECDAWNFPAMLAERRFRGEWLERQEFYNQALSRHRLILGKSLRGLEQVQTPEDLYRCYAQTKDAALWGEKSPLYGVRLQQLAQQYPQASFILIWRDPAEIYRSIEVASKRSAFFRRPGMLHRLIYHQEKMIHQVNELQRAGARMHHVHYDDLVENTEAVCRKLCGFLQIDFHPCMAGLEQADFSAVHRAPQHDFLRRGVVERQTLDHRVEKPIAQKLMRFQKRWERLAGRRFVVCGVSDDSGEPSAAALLYHRSMGAMLHFSEGCKRLGFEFLPLLWLQTYRQFKSWLLVREGAESSPSMGKLFRQHYTTVLASFLVFALVAFFDYRTGPKIAFGPLYLIPCAALALTVGRGWATIAAVGCAFAATAFHDVADPFHFVFKAPLLWNMLMRFIYFEIVVLLLCRIRRDFRTQTN